MYPKIHALNLIFDKEGICSGCRVHDEKYNIDWEQKEIELIGLIEQFKELHSDYDCIIPVVGNGDDYFVVDYVKNRLKLNPLLVTYNSHFNTKIGIRNLARLISKLDCDHITSTVSPNIVKEITRISLFEFGDVYWHVMAGHLTFPVQVATKLGVPLIIWGVNGWLDQVGMFSHLDKVEMTQKVRSEFGLRNIAPEYFINKSNLINCKDMYAFNYPTDKQIEDVKVRGLYLGNYVFWDSQRQTEQMIKSYGYETSNQERTYNTYETINCRLNASVQDYCKYLKFGYGKVNDHVARDIRLGRMTKAQGIRQIKKYLEIEPKALRTFTNWLGISRGEFYKIMDRHRHPNCWFKTDVGHWENKSDFSKIQKEMYGSTSINTKIERPYIQTEMLETEKHDDDFILLGRSYLDKLNFKAVEG